MLKTNGLKRALYMSVLLVFIQSGFIQAQPCDPGGGLGGTGTDVIIGDLVGTSNYGAAGGVPCICSGNNFLQHWYRASPLDSNHQ